MKTLKFSLKTKKNGEEKVSAKKKTTGLAASNGKEAPAAPTETRTYSGGYNAASDKLIKLIGVVECARDEVIEIAVRSYNGAPAKVSLLKKSEKYVSTKIGRMSAEEAVDIGTLIVEAAKVAKRWNTEKKGN